MLLNGERWSKNCCATFHRVRDVRAITQQMYMRLRHALEVEASQTVTTSHYFAGHVTRLLHRTRHKVNLKAGSRIVGMTNET